ncbi:MAG TPA: hypothetical protein VEU06_01300 [Micropepsaceae bacterium]|nr:hypothetical protein [Micropepsaceae bacterium]
MLRFSLRLFLLLLASYGLLYFTYKYYVPIRADFYEYYPMYQRPLDFTVAGAPFIYRQVSAVLTHLVYLSGVYYPHDIAFADPAIDQRLFFAALLTNYLGLVVAAAVAGSVAERTTGSFATAVIAGLLCLLSFHSQTAVIAGMTDGISWMFVAALYLFYVRNSRLPFAVLVALSVFQREVVPLAFALMAGFALLLRTGGRRYNLFVLACSSSAFAAYLALRLYLLPAPGNEYQISFATIIANLLSPQAVSLKAVVLQGFLSQNVVFIAALFEFTLWLRAQSVSRDFLVLVLAFAAIAVLALADGIAVNVGRIAGMLSPTFAATAAIALFRLERSYAVRQQSPH